MSESARPMPDAGSSATFGLRDDEGLRARKKKLTRRAIHEAALNLVAERGLDQVTTDEIAAAADVSPRTFFNYFPTKDAAVLGLPPDLAGVLGESLLARPDDEDLFAALTAVVRAWFVAVDQDPMRDLRRLVVGRDPRLSAAMIGANRELEAALVRAATERPRTPGDLHVRVMVAAVLGAARATYLHTQALSAKPEDAGPSAEETMDQAADQSRRFAAALDDTFALLAGGLDAPRIGQSGSA